MTFEVTQRDKKLLAFLAVVVIGVLFTVFGILPLLDTGSSLDTEIEVAQQSKQVMEEKIASLPVYQAQYEEADKAWKEEALNFSDMMSSQEIDKLVTGVMLSCSLEAKNMSITFKAEPQSLAPYYASEAAALAEQQKQEAAAAAQNGDAAAGTGSGAAAAGTGAADGQSMISVAAVSLTTEGDAVHIRQLIDVFSDDYPGIRITDLNYETNEITDKKGIVTSTSTVLRLEEKGKIALIGPMADARNNMCGMWSMTCTPSRHGTLLEGIRSAVGDKAEILYAKGSNVYYDAEMEKGAVGIRPLERGNDQQLLAEALRTAARADVIVAAVGECAEMSGESPSRTNLEIPDAQQDLLKALVKTGKPVVLLLFTGRPLILNWESEHIPSILNVWFGGSETGDAVADVLFGKAVPCGKLTTTFPRSVGQLPLFYNHLNTGRPDPDNRVFNRYASNYLDESNEPLYPFGYGLSYTDFVYGDLQLSSETLPKNGNLTASVTVTNKGNHDGYETVQIYLRDIYAEVARPVKELKGFDRIFLKKGESREVKFVLTEDDLKFYNSGLQYIYEPGEFDVMIGTNSRDVQTKRFIAE